MDRLLPHVKVRLVKLLASIADLHAVIGRQQLMLEVFTALALDGREQGGAENVVRHAARRLGPQGKLGTRDKCAFEFRAGFQIATYALGNFS